MSENYNISSSPHIRSKVTTDNIMRWVAIALLPATLFGVYNFGIDALVLILVTTATCVITEYIYQKLMKKKVTISDFSAVVTGLLLALNLPSSAPWWLGVIGGIFAIIVVKQLFGGLGQNIMNPALGARCFLLISFTGRMTDFTYDAFTGATPLAELKTYGSLVSFESIDLIIGNIPGTIGETSVYAIMLGAILLIMLDIIDYRIPVTYIVSFSIFIILFGGQGFNLLFLTQHLSSGGLMLGAWFMATDYVTSPITKKGQVVYGICLGVLTGVFRIFGGSSEGVSYAIIFSNLLVPLIERVTLPKPFGKGGEK
ncbi:MAG: RnfABCDGE type electron transport complex subunit D [Eubacteriales bacterium]